MTHQDLVGHFGNASKAAKALGYSRQAVSQWKDRGIPFEAQYRIQMRTKGRLRADISALSKKRAA